MNWRDYSEEVSISSSAKQEGRAPAEPKSGGGGGGGGGGVAAKSQLQRMNIWYPIIVTYQFFIKIFYCFFLKFFSVFLGSCRIHDCWVTSNEKN